MLEVFHAEAQVRRHVMNGLPYIAPAPEIIVQRVADLFACQAKKDVNAWRLYVGVNHADALPLSG